MKAITTEITKNDKRTNGSPRRSGAQAGWTPARRLRQAAAIRRWRPWAKSTGPRTPEGKARARMNAYKNGSRAAPARELCALLRLQRRFTRLVRQGLRLGLPERTIRALWDGERQKFLRTDYWTPRPRAPESVDYALCAGLLRAVLFRGFSPSAPAITPFFNGNPPRFGVSNVP